MEGRRDYRDEYEIMRAIISSYSSIRTTEAAPEKADGSNKIFTAGKSFYSNSLMVYVDGVRKFEGADYSVTGPNSIEFRIAPASGTVRLEYVTPDQLLER